MYHVQYKHNYLCVISLQAGIPRSNTLFISEPEAASLHCMGLGINNFHRATDLYFSKFKINLEGHQYMLIDAGGKH